MDMDQYSEVTSTSGIGGVKPVAEIAGKMDPTKTLSNDVKGMLEEEKFGDPMSCTTTTPRPPPALLDIKDKKYLYCGIKSCNSKAENLTLANSNVLAYYGYRNKLAVVKVCNQCLEKAEVHLQKSIKTIRKGNSSLFKHSHEPQVHEVVDLDDDDSNDEPDSSRRVNSDDDEVLVPFDRGDVEGLVHKALDHFNIQSQLDKSVKYVSDEANALRMEFSELESKMSTIENLLCDSYSKYKKVIMKNPEPLITEEVEIQADGSTRRRNFVAGVEHEMFVNEATLAKLPSLIKKQKERTDPDRKRSTDPGEVDDTENESVERSEETAAGPVTEEQHYELMEQDARRKHGPFHRKIEKPDHLQPKKKPLLPIPSVIPRITPKLGDIVYAMHKTLVNYWLQAEILEVLKNEDPSKPEFVVHFEPLKNDIPTGGVETSGALRCLRQVSLREMAYNVPCPFILPVGTRVIAKFVDDSVSDSDSDGLYYAGIIGEMPKEANGMRYLVFFDDGYAQYVENEEVLLICECSQQSWDDVHPDVHDFIKSYIMRYPDWPLVRLGVGNCVPVEWNGKDCANFSKPNTQSTWQTARVLKVDASMAKIKFIVDAREEWVYRGSSRLKPIFRTFKKEERQKQLMSNIPRHDKDHINNKDNHVVEYLFDEKSTKSVQRVARKSTGQYRSTDKASDDTHKFFEMMDVDTGIEFQGSLKKLVIPADVPRPKEFVPHECGPDCVVDYVPTKDLKTRSPLAIPLFLGWERDLVQAPNKHVFYRTPCGLRLRNYKELNRFIKQTDCNISVDHFCFDCNVDCLNEFVPSRVLASIKDISYGKENVPVQSVNSVDYETLPYMEYTPERVPGPGVNLNNEDEGFLACCDCTDNCEDKTKCACRKMTEEGISFSKLSCSDYPTTGYENRRLLNHIVSGIYECNNRCQCKLTCSNRVVQSGVKWPVQVFKTTKKGWGIRSLYDIPEGAFICVYTGDVLTDQAANEEGTEFGDEYLAELDYIECTEKVKENYESDVTDIEADESDSENESESASSGKRKRGDNSSCDSEPEADFHADDTDFKTKAKVGEAKEKRKVAKRKTDGTKINLLELMNSDRDMVTITAHSSLNDGKRKKKNKRFSIRDCFPEAEQSFIMDAKKKGNFGRYLNHACSPNVFVQNVFVDTHDMRFPMVAFFANSFIRAGTELTWDYHYEVGSVPGKVMYCFCMTPNCRGRLL